MLETIDFYYFSPTGGTKKSGKILACELAETVNEIDLADKNAVPASSDIVLVAAPVYGGRIPQLVSDKLAKLDGNGKKAITAVVYGVRAYDDALLELNDVMKNSGFEVVASAALVAQHSMVPEVGASRPDKADEAEIIQYAKRVADILKEDKTSALSVPGNYPYKPGMKTSATPISLSECTGCGNCASLCPTEAISVTDTAVTTDIEKCIMCMACVANCPAHSRILPPQIRAGLTQKLSVFKDVRRENEFYF